MNWRHTVYCIQIHIADIHVSIQFVCDLQNFQLSEFLLNFLTCWPGKLVKRQSHVQRVIAMISEQDAAADTWVNSFHVRNLHSTCIIWFFSGSLMATWCRGNAMQNKKCAIVIAIRWWGNYGWWGIYRYFRSQNRLGINFWWRVGGLQDTSATWKWESRWSRERRLKQTCSGAAAEGGWEGNCWLWIGILLLVFSCRKLWF